MNKIFYWSPFTSKVATVKAVINSVEAINSSYKNDNFKASIIDAVHEWKDFEDQIKEKKIQLIYLNKKSIFNKFKKDGFLRSRLAYWYIFFKSFFPLIKTLKENKPKFLIIHLITSLPLFLFIFIRFDSKLILRISGLPKMTFLRKILWKLAIKNVYKITCPTHDTLKDLSKFEFLKNKLYVLRDPILRIKEIQKMRKMDIKLDEPLSKIIEKKKIFFIDWKIYKTKKFFLLFKLYSGNFEIR